jgi:hypothetical protein
MQQRKLALGTGRMGRPEPNCIVIIVDFQVHHGVDIGLQYWLILVVCTVYSIGCRPPIPELSETKSLGPINHVQ